MRPANPRCHKAQIAKPRAAREIISFQPARPFVELNCANLSEQLVEAELFSYRRGAFTGADRDHAGLLVKSLQRVKMFHKIFDNRLFLLFLGE